MSIPNALPNANQEILLVLNKAEDTCSMIDTRTGKMLNTIPTGHGPNEVMVSPQGTWATISNMGNQKPDKTITVLKMPAGTVSRTIDLDKHARPHGMAWLDEKRIVLTTHEPDALHIVNVESGQIERTIASPDKGLHMIVLSPDKKFAYGSCAFANSMVAFDLEKSEVAYKVKCGPRAEGISISPDGKIVAVGNVGNDAVTLIDTQARSELKTLRGCPVAIRTLFVGDKLFVSSVANGEIVVWNTATWKVIKRIPTPAEPKGLPPGQKHPPMNFALSADRKLLYVVIVSANQVAVIDLGKLEIVKTFPTGKLPDGIAVWPVTTNQTN